MNQSKIFYETANKKLMNLRMLPLFPLVKNDHLLTKESHFLKRKKKRICN